MNWQFTEIVKLTKKRGGVIPSIILGAIIRLVYPCDISAFANIGKNVKILHAIGIIIGGTAIIEENVTIMPNVVIGSKMIGSSQNSTESKNSRRHAIIKRGCFIGANTSIIGNVIVGENTIIGAGSVITKNIPPNSIVTGINKVTPNKNLNADT